MTDPTDDATGLAALREAVEHVEHYAGCGDHSCLFVKPKGMGTNGGCRCLGRGGHKPGLPFALGKLLTAARTALRPTPPAPAEEKVAEWMLSVGLATGHGDTLEDLLREATWQIHELRETLAGIERLLRTGWHERLRVLLVGGVSENPRALADAVRAAVAERQEAAAAAERAIRAAFAAAEEK